MSNGRANDRLLRRNQRKLYKNGLPEWFKEEKQNGTLMQYKKTPRRSILKTYNRTVPTFNANKAYKRIKKEMDRTFTTYQNYIQLSPEKILTCSNLVRNKMDNKYKNAYRAEYQKYAQQNLKEKALQGIVLCLSAKYVLKSAHDYYGRQLISSRKTISGLKYSGLNYEFTTVCRGLYERRMAYLYELVARCEKINTHIENKINEYEGKIYELSLETKPNFIEAVFEMGINYFTAPVRRVVNLIDAVLSGDEIRILKTGGMFLIGIIGADIIHSAIDALDIFDIDSGGTDIFVSPHQVHEYYREDGTHVNSYYRDGDGNPLTHLTKEDGGGWYRKIKE